MRDLDSIELVELASTAGALPARPLRSVAHAPATPPAARRLARLLAKIDAGADVVFAEAVLAVPGVDGVNLSAGTGPGQELAVTRAMAEVSRRVRGARAAGRPRPAGRVS